MTCCSLEIIVFRYEEQQVVAHKCMAVLLFVDSQV